MSEIIPIIFYILSVCGFYYLGHEIGKATVLVRFNKKMLEDFKELTQQKNKK